MQAPFPQQYANGQLSDGNCVAAGMRVALLHNQHDVSGLAASTKPAAVTDASTCVCDPLFK